jgi:hypothetical protein
MQKFGRGVQKEALHPGPKISLHGPVPNNPINKVTSYESCNV